MLVRELTRKSTMVTSTMPASSGSSQVITPSIATRVNTLTSSGMPAVTATSCSRPTSETSRCTMSAVRAVPW